jgi:hypothetical protein
MTARQDHQEEQGPVHLQVRELVTLKVSMESEHSQCHCRDDEPLDLKRLMLLSRCL